MRKSTIAALIVTFVVALGASACSDDSSDESSSTTTTEKETSSDSDSSDGFEISTPEGQVSVSLDGELPPGWPEDYPLPEKTDTAGSGSLADSSQGVMVGVYSTEQSGQDAFDFFAGESSLEPSSESSAGGSNAFLGSMTTAGSYPGSVTVGEIDGTTYIVVILTTDGAGASTTTTTAGA